MSAFTCTICLDSKPITSAISLISPTCTHPAEVCSPCLQTHLATHLSTRNLRSPTCPSPSCSTSIPYSYVQAHHPTLTTLYSDALLRIHLSKHPDYRVCLAPSCSGGQLHSGGAVQPIVTCPVCSAKSCFTDRIPWHEGRSCASVQKEQKANTELMKKTTMVCPGCGIRVEKIDGCDHIKCRCGSDWCWLCGVDYAEIHKKGNHAHKKGCGHWRGPNGEGGRVVLVAMEPEEEPEEVVGVVPREAPSEARVHRVQDMVPHRQVKPVPLRPRCDTYSDSGSGLKGISTKRGVAGKPSVPRGQVKPVPPGPEYYTYSK